MRSKCHIPLDIGLILVPIDVYIAVRQIYFDLPFCRIVIDIISLQPAGPNFTHICTSCNLWFVKVNKLLGLVVESYTAHSSVVSITRRDRRAQILSEICAPAIRVKPVDDQVVDPQVCHCRRRSHANVSKLRPNGSSASSIQKILYN